jgi:signal transduction histidine kinase
MDGLRFLERVRMEPAWVGIPFVLLTARTDAASRLEGFSLGANDYVEKPFSEPELLSRVGNLVRNHTLMEKRVEDARDEAVKSILLQRLSHEFRTPLNAILGYSELILDMSELEGTPFKWEDELNRIHDAGERLLALVEQLLDVSVSGGESEGVELVYSTFDVGGLLSELMALLEQRVVGRGVSFSVSCAPELSLHSDRVALSKVLYNILENACRFSNKGNVFVDFVEASADCAIQKEEGYVFRISDSGMGIEEEHLQSIFEPFRQVDESHTRPYDGAGLGLSIAHELVLQLGGTIEARNRPEKDRGAEFVIWLPG